MADVRYLWVSIAYTTYAGFLARWNAVFCDRVYTGVRQYTSMRQRSPSLRLEVNQVKDISKRKAIKGEWDLERGQPLEESFGGG